MPANFRRDLIRRLKVNHALFVSPKISSYTTDANRTLGIVSREPRSPLCDDDVLPSRTASQHDFARRVTDTSWICVRMGQHHWKVAMLAEIWFVSIFNLSNTNHPTSCDSRTFEAILTAAKFVPLCKLHLQYLRAWICTKRQKCPSSCTIKSLFFFFF